jgi:hypothetical protein
MPLSGVSAMKRSQTQIVELITGRPSSTDGNGPRRFGGKTIKWQSTSFKPVKKLHSLQTSLIGGQAALAT